MRTRRSPMVNVRHSASPVVPGWRVASTFDQSVTVNGRAGIFIRGALQAIAGEPDLGAGGGNRTRTPLAPDFKSGASTSSATPARGCFSKLSCLQSTAVLKFDKAHSSDGGWTNRSRRWLVLSALSALTI